jgi:transcriptional regulator with XRE-family HTH domain
VTVAEQFGANLRYCRKLAKLSQEELAVRASIHRTAVGMIERGERVPRIDTLVKLTGALRVSADELLDGLEWEPGDVLLGRFRQSNS